MLFSIFQRAWNWLRIDSRFVYFAVSAFTFFGLVIAVLNARPIQDDYATLYLLTENGLLGYLETTWDTHGGNLTPMFFNALFLLPSISGQTFWALSIFPVVNYLLLQIAFFSAASVLNPFSSRRFTRIQVFTFVNLVFLGSESLFSPQFLEMTLFSSAVLVHLWPILFFFLALGLLNSKGKASFGALIALGFLSGNSNISESLFIQLSCLLILVLKRIRIGFNIEIKRFVVFALSNLIGTLMILTAPGFWNRANEKNAQGIPDQFSEFFLRFAKSFVVFSADVVSHPMLLIFIIIGFNFAIGDRRFLNAVTQFAVLLFALLFGSLVIGATIAYPAWHQSIGLVLLSPFVGMSVGEWIKSKNVFSLRTQFTFYSIVAVLVLVTLLRAFSAMESRAHQWDLGFAHNYCAVIADSPKQLIGTETIYPISNLGIEDLNRWPWMRNAFTGWVTNSKFSERIC